jgi:hypothetical protein
LVSYACAKYGKCQYHCAAYVNHSFRVCVHSDVLRT